MFLVAFCSQSRKQELRKMKPYTTIRSKAIGEAIRQTWKEVQTASSAGKNTVSLYRSSTGFSSLDCSVALIQTSPEHIEDVVYIYNGVDSMKNAEADFAEISKVVTGDVMKRCIINNILGICTLILHEIKDDKLTAKSLAFSISRLENENELLKYYQ